MANIILGHRKNFDKRGNPIIDYAECFRVEIENLGHKVLSIGEGHPTPDFSYFRNENFNLYDLFVDVDCGRNSEGTLSFHCAEQKLPIPSAVRFIDSHGFPSYHKRAAPNYDYVFFAVWDKRDLFYNHPSAHWCPNASDANWFIKQSILNRPIDAGFFGSKGGLDRADILKRVCKRQGLICDVREMGRRGNRWPHTGEAMSQCKILFNMGQKHDGPNQRVIESMLINRPLITDRDPKDGMSKLFEVGEHYLSYEGEAELAGHIKWCLEEPHLAASMALSAYDLAIKEHQVKHRVQQILEVCFVKN